MNGGDVTVKISHPEIAEPRLLADSSAPNRSDQTFEEKLDFAKARLGLLFSPINQFNSFFSFFPEQGAFNQNKTTDSLLTSIFADSNNTSSSSTNYYTKVNTPVTENQPGSIDQIPQSQFNRQVLAELLLKTNWLIPNLEAAPPFYQAFLEGKLQPKMDLQFLIDQIIEQAALVKEKGKTELRLSLKPEILGEIFLILTATAGAVAVQIQATTETKKLIESQITELKSALKRAGVKIEQLLIEEVNLNA